jgi:hypothetical protein
MSINKRRRKFLLDATKVMAAASVSALLPSELRAAAGPRHSSETLRLSSRSPRMVSMIAARARELGDQVFTDVPKPLRSSALQIQSTLMGIKPSCRLSLSVNDLQESIGYLKSLSCNFRISQAPVKKASFAQMSPGRRKLFKASQRMRVYLAKTSGDAERLARLETDGRDYRALGLALGYPSCCVEVAEKNDHAYFDEKNQVWRQANLNAVAVRASTAADFRCNQFLVESELYTAGPLSAIAHYPCRLDCAATIAAAQEVLECGAHVWPLWTVTLCELLRAPVVYWSDESWAPEYWDEYCGLALVEASQDGQGRWHSVLSAIPLGAERIPAGPLPESVVGLELIKNNILLRNATGMMTSYPLNETGSPWIIDWTSKRVSNLA